MTSCITQRYRSAEGARCPNSKGLHIELSEANVALAAMLNGGKKDLMAAMLTSYVNLKTKKCK